MEKNKTGEPSNLTALIALIVWIGLVIYQIIDAFSV